MGDDYLRAVNKEQQSSMLHVKRIAHPEALALCQRREGDLFDRKAAAIDGRKVERIAVALRNNADGGEFILGISRS